MAANIKCIIRVNVTTQFILTGYVIIQLYVCFVKILFYFRLQKHVAISKRSQYVPFWFNDNRLFGILNITYFSDCCLVLLGIAYI